MKRILFVCLGNICRSPTAEAVMRAMVEEANLSHLVEVQSAGTHAYHVGEGADPRSARAAKARGYDLSRHRARSVVADDFQQFDYVLAMDKSNLRHLRALAARASAPARVGALLDFAPHVAFDEVPDPYGRADDGFEIVLDIVEEGARGLLEHLRRHDLAVHGDLGGSS